MLILVLVLKDSLRTKFKSLSWSLCVKSPQPSRIDAPPVCDLRVNKLCQKKLFHVSDVNKDWTCKDKDKDKDQAYKDQDKDKD